MTEAGGTANAGEWIRSVTIVGLGVMGGSVAKAVASRAPDVPLFGVEPDPASARTAARDGVRPVADLGECRLDGGVVVFAAPLDRTAALVRDTAAVWSGAALATDAASLKVPVLAAARRGGGAEVFVGAHPMCGSERSGYAAARADMFEGADVWLCPANPGKGVHEAVGASAVDLASSFWRLLGARPRTIGAERHDRLMAWASHLPQLLAGVLAETLDGAGVGRDELGPGGRDMTRLAASSPEVWTPLLEAAATEDARALRAVETQIAAVRRALEAGDTAAIARILKRGKRWTAAKV